MWPSAFAESAQEAGVTKLNCWELKRCGRQPGGARASELGVCPASTERRVDGMNRGTNGGRVCWAVAGTLCGGRAQGTYAMQLANCMECDFYRTVMYEERPDFCSVRQVLARLK